MRALIDGDIIVYRNAWAAKDESEAIAKHRVDAMIDRILEDTDATEFQVYLSDSTENGFRYRIYPKYKSNRPEKPPFYDLLKEHLILEFKATITMHQEADDALGIAQTDYRSINVEGDPLPVICSLDKDLNQIPGDHYSIGTRELYYIDPHTAMERFYEQVLTGDRADNIPGLWMIGPTTAEKILKGCNSEKDMFFATLDTYHRVFEKEWGKDKTEWTDFKYHQMLNLLLIYGRLLKIRTKEEEIWDFPEGTVPQPLLQDIQLSSIQ